MKSSIFLPVFRNVCIFLGILAFSRCQRPAPAPVQEITSRPLWSAQYPVQNSDRTRTDTLYVHSDGLEYALLWKKDTLLKQYSYKQPANFVSPLGALGFTDLFLIEMHQGDGCPSGYYLLAFDDTLGYHLSEPFGNCNEPASVSMSWPVLTWQFEATPEANRLPLEVRYNRQTYELTTKH